MTNLITAIDKLLPQIQCRECGYDNCMAYAKAVAEDVADINLCRPGGNCVVSKIGLLLGKDLIAPAQTVLPLSVAVIRESDCIGCTMCLKACPIDVIVGANKQLHRVIADDCSGCGLCVVPCPADCIDMVKVEAIEQKPELWRSMAKAKLKRVEIQHQEKVAKKQKHKVGIAESNLENKVSSSQLEKIMVARAKVKAKIIK